MDNLARLTSLDQEIRGLTGDDLLTAIAMERGYRIGSALSRTYRRFYSDPGFDTQWFACQPNGSWHPVHPGELTLSPDRLAIQRTDDLEDWIHVEYGPDARWIIRLLRFTRIRTGTNGDTPQPAPPSWNSIELYRVDRDDDPIPLSTAYAQAWLYSRRTWPTPPRR